jgi:hypothetical protein
MSFAVLEITFERLFFPVKGESSGYILNGIYNIDNYIKEIMKGGAYGRSMGDMLFRFGK